MTFTELANPIFVRAIDDYHVTDSVETPINNPYEEGSIENRLYLKCWIDTVQWHFEDIIRDPQIDPAAALVLKRRIDKSNQDRTDLVEQIDSYFGIFILLSRFWTMQPLIQKVLLGQLIVYRFLLSRFIT